MARRVPPVLAAVGDGGLEGLLAAHLVLDDLQGMVGRGGESKGWWEGSEVRLQVDMTIGWSSTCSSRSAFWSASEKPARLASSSSSPCECMHGGGVNACAPRELVEQPLPSGNEACNQVMKHAIR